MFSQATYPRVTIFSEIILLLENDTIYNNFRPNSLVYIHRPRLSFLITMIPFIVKYTYTAIMRKVVGKFHTTNLEGIVGGFESVQSHKC